MLGRLLVNATADELLLYQRGIQVARYMRNAIANISSILSRLLIHLSCCLMKINAETLIASNHGQLHMFHYGHLITILHRLTLVSQKRGERERLGARMMIEKRERERGREDDQDDEDANNIKFIKIGCRC